MCLYAKYLANMTQVSDVAPGPLLTVTHLIFGTLLCHTKIQIKFEFGSDPLIFHEVMAVGLRKISRIISFPDFSLSAYRYSFNIWYIVLRY
jgi:hypothetical protein